MEMQRFRSHQWVGGVTSFLINNVAVLMLCCPLCERIGCANAIKYKYKTGLEVHTNLRPTTLVGRYFILMTSHVSYCLWFTILVIAFALLRRFHCYIMNDVKLILNYTQSNIACI